MINERTPSRSGSGAVTALQARIARYREHAAHFTELAGTEAVEKIRDQWEHLARDYAYLAARLESD